jgi:hypothetical protein
MIEQQLVASKAVLHLAAHYRETVLHNAVQKALRQTQRGKEDTSAGVFIRPDQQDPLTGMLLINKLLLQGIDIQRMRSRMTIEDVVYPSGTYFIPFNQPKRGVVKSLLERTFFPDDDWTRFEDGTPNRPYDTTTDTIAEMMGVTVEPVPIDLDELSPGKNTFSSVTASIQPIGQVAGDGAHGYVIDTRMNASYRAVNQLLAAGCAVGRTNQMLASGKQYFYPGSFIVTDSAGQDLSEIVEQSGVSLYSLDTAYEGEIHPLSVPRIGMYRRYWGGNMDEGWTRLVLEQFDFPYQALWDEAIVAGDLNKTYDTIILPNDSTAMMLGEEEQIKQRLNQAPVPEQYQSGIGEAGVKQLKTFVEAGGTLIALNQSCAFVLEKLGLQMTNVVGNLSRKEFFCPGSTLHVNIDIDHTLGYGMPREALALCWDSPVFSINPSYFNDHYHVVASYPMQDVLQSGWLIGEEHLAGHAAMVSVEYGKGRVVLYGFWTQFRAQAHGTFKLLFNALMR